MNSSFVERDERPKHEDPPFVDLVVGPSHETDNRRFGQILEAFRQLAGLSRSEAAARLNVSPEYLRLIELGRRSPAMGQMPGFLDAYKINGELGRLQPGGNRPDLIFFPPDSDEPLTVDFASRIREARRSGVYLSADTKLRADILRRAESELPTRSRAVELGYIVSLLATADDRTISEVYELLQKGAGS